MGTRSNIVRKNEDGSFDSIYCHWDGYPEHHAPILLEHYSTPEKVQALLDLGSLSSLDIAVGEKHSFDTCPEGQCNAYGRDRGEENTQADHFKDHESLTDYMKQAWTEWIYVWVQSEGRWYFTNNPSPTWFKCCGTSQKDMVPLENWEQAMATS